MPFFQFSWIPFIFQRDIDLQQRVLNWIIEILDERPKGKMDYDEWLRDGTILVKGKTSSIILTRSRSFSLKSWLKSIDQSSMLVEHGYVFVPHGNAMCNVEKFRLIKIFSLSGMILRSLSSVPNYLSKIET